MCSLRLRTDCSWFVRVAAGTALLLAVVNTACHESATPAPSDPYVGLWSGTMADLAAGNGTLRMSLTDTVVLSGAWSLTMAGQTIEGGMSELPPPPGTSGRYFALSCGPAPGNGSLVLNTTINGNTLVGTYRSLGCAGLTTGGVQLTRR